MHADPRQWKVQIDGRPLTSFEELVNLLHEAGFHVVQRPPQVISRVAEQHAPAPDYRLCEEDDS